MLYRALLTVSGLAVLGGCASNPRFEAAGDIAPAMPAIGRYMPTGSPLDVRLDQAIGTSRSRGGDTFSATVVNPLLTPDGVTVVPAGARVFGHVTGLTKSGVSGQQSVIRIAFDRLRVNGLDYPFDASVVSVNIENRPAPPIAAEERSARTGAAAGTAISFGNGSTSSEIPAGSTMMLRSTQPVQLR